MYLARVEYTKKTTFNPDSLILLLYIWIQILQMAKVHEMGGKEDKCLKS